MATIPQDIAQIRTAVYGRDVREAIADGIEQIAAIAEGTGTAVLYTAQTLNASQKQQARINIGVYEMTEDSNGLVFSQ